MESLLKRIAASILAIARLLYFRPVYFLIALVTSFVFYQFIFWMLNLGLLQYLMTDPYVTLSQKIDIITGSYYGVFKPPFDRLAVILFAVSMLQGIAVAVMTYLVRRERSMNRDLASNFGGAGIAGVFSVIGLGCAACGTSLVTPVLTLFFATSSVAAAEIVGYYSAVLALVASIATVYMAGVKLIGKF